MSFFSPTISNFTCPLYEALVIFPVSRGVSSTFALIVPVEKSNTAGAITLLITLNLRRDKHETDNSESRLSSSRKRSLVISNPRSRCKGTGRYSAKKTTSYDSLKSKSSTESRHKSRRRMASTDTDEFQTDKEEGRASMKMNARLSTNSVSSDHRRKSKSKSTPDIFFKSLMENQNTMQTLSVVMWVSLEIYKALTASLLIIFVTQNANSCAGSQCSAEENASADDDHPADRDLYITGLCWNYSTFFVFVCLYTIEILREVRLIQTHTLIHAYTHTLKHSYTYTLIHSHTHTHS